MKMKTKGSPGFGRELLRDAVFPARCPVCADLIPFARRLQMYGALNRAGIGAAATTAAVPQSDLFNTNVSEKLPDWQRDLFPAMYRGLVCDGCLGSLSFIREPYCGKCGKQLSAKDGINRVALCHDCAASERSFAQCRCILNYEETAREIMAGIKYQSRPEALELLALLAADRLGDWILHLRPYCLIPVPIHSARLKERGFNQAAVLAASIGTLLGIPVREDILIRNKKTSAQKELGVSGRLLNLQQAFAAVKRLPQGATVLLVDDIYTTGATLEACTERLREAGAGAVYGLCICAGEDRIA